MSDLPFDIERTPDGMRISFELEASKVEKQLKRATFAQFEMLSDESVTIGGDDAAPPPLAYFAAALAF